MKQKTYITGLLTVFVIFAGALFKIQHWPGAGIILTIGIASLVLVFLPMAICEHYRSSGNSFPLLHFITWLTCFVMFTAMLFRLMHWPFAGIGLLIALPFPYIIFLPLFLVSTSKDKSFSINNLVAVLFLLVVSSVFSALLALNVSKERIVDSYNIGRDYFMVESLVSELPVVSSDPALINKIDNAVGIITDYEEVILKAEGSVLTSLSDLNIDLKHPDTKGLASGALIGSGELQYGSKLAAALDEVMVELNKNSDYQSLVNKMPDITGFDASANFTQWADASFKENACYWSLTYLEGLKANLLTLKASLL